MSGPKPALDDDRLMSLVELALAQPPSGRDIYVRSACGDNPELIDAVRRYVAWEERMDGFLLRPLFPAPDIEHRLEPGDLLAGRFRIVRALNEGGMGIVYEAVDEKLERRVAIKCAKAGFRKRLSPEVRHASEISHRNVCKIHELHTAVTGRGEVDFITMQLLEGETLFTRLRGGRLPESQARSIARQLCAGLAEAHRHRVIHGDLKSNNVILAPDADGTERAVITDFGLARGPAANAARGAAESLEAGGAPDYMAPELWKGEKASAASDVYALGVLLCELATGKRPFGPDVALEERLASPPPAIHPKWDAVLSRCLAPDPAKRFRDAAEVAKALDPPRPQRWWLTAAAALVLSLVAAWVTYDRATAPKESWRLAVMPVEALSPDTLNIASDLSSKVAGTLRHINGGRVAGLSIVPPEKAQSVSDATHIVRATISRQNGKLLIQATIGDKRSSVNVGERTLVYGPGDERYAPVALAGVVTATLKLPPLTVPSVNSRAAKNYWDGVWYTRQNSTLDKAIQCLRQAVQEDPDSALTWAALAEAQWFEYHFSRDQAWRDRARDSLQEAEARNPDVALAHRVEGYIQYTEGFRSQAEAEFKRAITLQPRDAIAHIWLGKTYEDDNRLDDALASFLKGSEVEPSYFKPYFNVGSFYNNRAYYRESSKQLEKSVLLAPNEADPHFALGEVYMNLGRFHDAENELRDAIRLSETPTALHTLGVDLIYEHRNQEAVEYITRALKLGPERYLWWMTLGMAERQLGLSEQSTRAYNRAFELAEAETRKNPKDGYTRSKMAYLLARLGNRQRAESEIAQALQLTPSNAEVRSTAAETYEALAEREETLKILSSSTDEVIADLSRWPEVAELQNDPRFQQLLIARQIK